MLTAAACLESTATEWGSSRWATHNRCGQEYDLRYNRKIRRLPMTAGVTDPSKANPLNVGTLVHGGIRLVETGSMTAAAAIEALGDAAALNPRFSRFDVAEAERLLTAYWAHWGEEYAGWREGVIVEATELQLKAAGLQHTGAVDTLLRYPDGSVAIVDTKTRAQKLPDDCERLFATNPQFLSLSYMLQELMDLDSPPPVIVNAIVKTKVPDFDRPVVRFTQTQVDRWAGNQRLIEEQNERHVERGSKPSGDTRLYTMNYNACAPPFGYKCDYFDYCHALGDEARALHFSEAA